MKIAEKRVGIRHMEILYMNCGVCRCLGTSHHNAQRLMRRFSILFYYIELYAEAEIFSNLSSYRLAALAPTVISLEMGNGQDVFRSVDQLIWALSKEWKSVIVSRVWKNWRNRNYKSHASFCLIHNFLQPPPCLPTQPVAYLVAAFPISRTEQPQVPQIRPRFCPKLSERRETNTFNRCE